MSASGHHKVFLGMAAGVGKTYRMLQEGRAERRRARRRDRLPRAARPRGDRGAGRGPAGRCRAGGSTYRDIDARGDGPARRCSRARPSSRLIDELAHTNAPGVEHAKRYEDVDDVLAAGIDVFSTVNVQHLESLNDQVAELTGVRVRETLPDAVLRRADEVVLVDLTPEALIERLRAGKVYPPAARAGGAQQLLQGREPRGAARGRAAPGRRGGRGQAARARASPARARTGCSTRAAPQAVGERLLALVTPQAELAADRAARVALGAAARRRARHPERGRAPAASPTPRRRAARRAAPARVGARRAPARRAGRRRRRGRRARWRASAGTTYVLMGAAARRAASRGSREPLPTRLLRRAARRRPAHRRRPRRREER